MIRRQGLSLSKAHVEKMRDDSRRKDFAREDNLKVIAQDKRLRANLTSDERVENKR